MHVSNVSQSPAFIPLSSFGRVVRFVKNLPQYAQKTVNFFDDWYLSLDLRTKGATPLFCASLGIFGNRNHIPFFEVAASFGFAYIHYLILRYGILERIGLTREVSQKIKLIDQTFYDLKNRLRTMQALDLYKRSIKEKSPSPPLAHLDLATHNPFTSLPPTDQQIDSLKESLIEKGKALKEANYSQAEEALKTFRKWKKSGFHGNKNEIAKVSGIFKEIDNELWEARVLHTGMLPFWLSRAWKYIRG